jgi:hypothetical protein
MEIESSLSVLSDLKIDKRIWRDRLLEYFVLFVIVLIFGKLIITWLNVVPTDLDSAKYFLSSMVQAQAAIIALVVTLTLVAIQMAASSYTPRVIDVMMKSPDLWFLLVIYIASISIGFIALKLVADWDLVSFVLILGIYTFLTLFPYMIHTIKLLRPDEVVKRLVSDINAENIYEKEWTDDIMQPVFDVVHASIMRYDVTTTRTGLKDLSKRLLELFLSFDKENREKKAEDITKYFCNHIERSALVAFRNDDEGILIEIIEILDNFGTHTACNNLELATEQVANALGAVGIRTVDKGEEKVIEHVAIALGDIGTSAAKNRLESATKEVVENLGELGHCAADNQLETATERAVKTLGKLGIDTANNQLKEATGILIHTLAYVADDAAEHEMTVAVWNAVSWLGEIGVHAADNHLENATLMVVITLDEMDTKTPFSSLSEIFISLGTHAADNEMEEPTERVIEALTDWGIYFTKEGNMESKQQALNALFIVNIHAENKGLENAVKQVANALASIH